MELNELRDRVDLIDGEILNLNISRQDLISDIYRYKNEINLPIYSIDREHEVFEKINSGSDEVSSASLKLLFGILMDIHKFEEYLENPKSFVIPTGAGGASVRAILSEQPGALCRYLSPLATAGIPISDIRSKSLPGGKLVVDLELPGNSKDPRFISAISVLSDTAEKFTLL